ncbi:MAG: site-specific DNA-methyltransferase [Chloroflexota bacterium]
MPRTEKANSQYKIFRKPDGPDPRGPFRKINTTANGKGGRFVASLYYPLINPYTQDEVWPREGTCWRHSREDMAKLQSEHRLYWGVKGTAKTPVRKLYLSEVKQGMITPSIWDGVALNQHTSSEMEKLFGEKASFETPKPEALLEKLIHIATNPGDLVLDSFAGSGTTGAVAHKMGRRWIMVELGDHCHTHIIPRLQKVIDGDDPGGITKAVDWQGGGGFRYFRLAPSLLEKDRWGNWVINQQYNAEMLAEAVCKLEGFTYAPSESLYWQHGYSTEQDFIYVTTQTLTHEQLLALSDEVGSERTLLVLCAAYRAVADTALEDAYPIKKIPNAVMRRCEYGKDDYSLQVENLPQASKESAEETEFFQKTQFLDSDEKPQLSLFGQDSNQSDGDA